MVMLPDQFKVPHSLERIIRSRRFEIRFDTVFSEVIHCCASVPRPGQDGTWISPDFIEAYIDLHTLGFAHSVEVFYEKKLVGGLYGVSLGKAFFGESMFYTIDNASKVAFHALVDRCKQLSFKFIDCQMETSHLRRFGAIMVDRKYYLSLLEKSLKEETIKGSWI
jgi:leucyl/phenylalanyl-tRNA--protein transferase